MAFNEEALGPARCCYCHEVLSLCQCEYPAQDYEELVRKLVRKIDELSSPREADQRDAARYRWLRDVGDSTWAPLGKRPGVQFTHEIDNAIDAALKRQSDTEESK